VQECSVNSITVKPVDPTAKAAGEKTTFAATPLSAPNACYPDGQPLNPDKYVWSWKSANTAVADVDGAASVSSTQPFSMLGNGVVKDFYQTTVITAGAENKTGASNWALFCGSPPAACPAGTYPGTDKCCHVPPKIISHYPKTNDMGVCRNTLITLDVNDLLDKKTVTPDSVRLGYETKGDPCNGTLVDGYCFGVTPYSLAMVNTTQTSGVRIGHVSLNLEKMLPPNTKMKVVTAALMSQTNVPVQPETWGFTTGKNPCQISLVGIFPQSVVFSKLTDTKDLTAEARSKQGGAYVPVSSIPGDYAWDWAWLAPKKKIVKFFGDTKKVTTTIQPGGTNGTATVTAQAFITADKYFTPSTVGTEYAGYTNVLAALCEVPWQPAGGIPFLVQKPFTDKDHNMSLWYCRSSEKGVLLPDLVPTKTALTDIEQFITLDAFTLQDPVSGGAIGVRIEKNLKHLSPREWFLTKGFKGDLTNITVDGYEGVRSGNTVYVGFGNQIGSDQLYSNILVMSVSEPATGDMVNIFNQLLDNTNFLVNFTDTGLCTVFQNKKFQQTQTSCASRLDCVAAFKDESAVCDANRSNFRLDMTRVTHVAAMGRALEKIKAATGQYPVMAAGTYVPGLVSSKWPSWDTFMQQLGITPVADPINAYVSCGQSCSKKISQACTADADCKVGGTDNGTCVTYDANTCWSAQSKLYRCSLGSSVYHYQSLNNGSDYKLWFESEQSVSGWNEPVLTPHTDLFFCAGDAPVTPQNICGDGLKSASEECDPPGSKVTAPETTCTYGQAIKTCAKDCTFDKSFQCVNKCGDGVVQPPEVCDEGVKYNGLYNHCPADCGVASKQSTSALGACGDGLVQKNEVCDIANPIGKKLELFIATNSKRPVGVVCSDKKYDSWDGGGTAVKNDLVYLDTLQKISDANEIPGQPAGVSPGGVAVFCSGTVGVSGKGICKNGLLDCSTDADCGAYKPCILSGVYGACSGDQQYACSLTQPSCFPGLGLCNAPVGSR
ncbi:hypothetical protein HY065_02480, partial [Candidatus Berkelbacteria bacterium]|nr:hypothetical protein [Candidatus Berkelbacteria bacterium]